MESLAPVFAISGALLFIVILFLVGLAIYRRGQRDIKREEHLKAEQDRIEHTSAAKEAGRVVEIEKKVESAAQAPGLDQAEDVLSSGWKKARETK